MVNLQPVEVGEELTVSSSQSKDCVLSYYVQLVDAALFCPNNWAVLPLRPEVVSSDGLCFAVGHSVYRLLQLASHF